MSTRPLTPVEMAIVELMAIPSEGNTGLHTTDERGVRAPPRKKASYVGAPACFALELACKTLTQAYGCMAVYHVGSSMDRPDWRDIDVRMILPDEQFAREFPDAGQHWEQDPKWLLLTVAISGWLKQQTGLPVDFQIQSMTHANEDHPGPRSAHGLHIKGNA